MEIVRQHDTGLINGCRILILDSLLDDTTIFYLRGIPAPSPAQGHDRCHWENNSQGVFTVSSAYNDISENQWAAANPIWLLIRKQRVPERLGIFLWSDYIPWSTIFVSLIWQADIYGSKTAAVPTTFGLRRAIEICWEPLSMGTFYLNTDGSVDQNNRGSAGGVLRDHLGSFIMGFNRNLGTTTVIQSKLWGILQGLSLAWDRGFRHVILQNESSDAFKMLTSASPNSLLTLVRTIFELINRNWRVDFKLIRKEANMVVDSLAKIDDGCTHAIRIFYVCPSDIQRF
ncbi:hypothetical protein F3Y22_tig00113725pilonHSYRG00943 [Hibiscus syriacus]|uniref:RNase H type-1 domain-containing protein n=1 Tax=Hibiscus syriacus TaxID=106335 RepID=A0A6A2XT03_HIBSY|nr:hypothetical protein F3Y22_tig00113725pilonHSYRG00943 [Hibiscus syriacus]